MIDFLKETTLYGVPWWVWGLPAPAVALGIFIFVNRTLGFRNALVAAGAFLSAAIVAMSYQRGRQQGWSDRRAKESRDAEALVNRIKTARERARNADPGKLRDDDGFKRKS